MASLKCFFLDHGYDNATSSACCQMTSPHPRSDNFANLHTKTKFIKLKKSMDAGIWHSACEQCRVIEDLQDAQAQSKRQHSLQRYTFSDYTKNSGLINLQLTPGYLCNLQCRSCNPFLSSSWVKEDIEMPTDLSITPRDKFSIPIKINRPPSLNYNDNWSSVKYINFVGGEPLYNPEFTTLLNKLLTETNGDCDVSITTNCTVPLDLVKYQLLTKFRRVHLTVSIDSIGNSAEFIRTGTIWNKVVKNIEFYKSTEIFKNTIYFHLTNSILNILETPVTLDWLESMDIPPCGLTTHVTTPVHLTYSVLNNFEKQEITKRLAGTKADYITSALTSYQHNPIARSNFLLFMEHTKAYHGQDWKDYLPNLYNLMNLENT